MLKPNFNKQQIAAMLQRKRESIFTAIQIRLQRIGEAFVTNARLNGNYKDHTGNLRSSIGYVILRDGVQVGVNLKAIQAVAIAKQQIKHRNLQADSGFSQSADSGLIADEAAPAVIGNGQEKAKKLLDEIAAKFPRGIVLICVAGEEYAAAVESKGFDVITGSSLIAKNDLEKAMADIQRKANSNPLN